PNTGSAPVTLPNISTSLARIKVAALGNIFFGISTTNFTITPTATGPANDLCANAAPLTNGSTPFTTVGASTDGPAEPQCSLGADGQVNQDVWYVYTAQCTGRATLGVCDANFDTRVAIYSGSGCPAAPALAVACDDNSCGQASQVTWYTYAGGVYKIRI